MPNCPSSWVRRRFCNAPGIIPPHRSFMPSRFPSPHHHAVSAAPNRGLQELRAEGALRALHHAAEDCALLGGLGGQMLLATVWHKVEFGKGGIAWEKRRVHNTEFGKKGSLGDGSPRTNNPSEGTEELLSVHSSELPTHMHALPTQRIPSLTSHSPSPLSHLSLEEAVGQVHAPLHQRATAAVDRGGKGALPGLVAGGGDVGGVIHARHTLLVEAHT